MILGVSYKGGVGDIRESPALRIIEVLAERGAILSYHDPFVPDLPEFAMSSIPFEDVTDSDAVVLVTAHPGVDLGSVVAGASLLVDLRGVTRKLRAQNVVRL